MSDKVPSSGGLKQLFSSNPWWGWVFAAACLAIPVIAVGGAIPGALGFGSAAMCLTLAKNTTLPVRTRALQCSAVTLGAWLLFLLLVFLVRGGSSTPAVTIETRDASGKVTVTHASERPPTDLDDEAVRREIYTKATRVWKTLDRHPVDSTTEFGRKRLKQLEKMHAEEIEFTMKFYQLSRSQVDEVIEEGDRSGWSRD